MKEAANCTGPGILETIIRRIIFERGNRFRIDRRHAVHFLLFSFLFHAALVSWLVRRTVNVMARVKEVSRIIICDSLGLDKSIENLGRLIWKQ